MGNNYSTRSGSELCCIILSEFSFNIILYVVLRVFFISISMFLMKVWGRNENNDFSFLVVCVNRLGYYMFLMDFCSHSLPSIFSYCLVQPCNTELILL